MSNEQNLQNLPNLPEEVKQAILKGEVQSIKKEQEYFPTEVVDIPSQGKYYPEGHPLSSGRVELRYPTAKEENILVSKNLISKGTAMDAFLNSLIVDRSIRIDDMLGGDKAALIMAARIMAYGKEYVTKIKCPKCQEENEQVIDLSLFKNKELNFDGYENGIHKVFLNVCKKWVGFKILTQRDESEIEAEIKAYKKLSKMSLVSPDITVRLKHQIVEVDGNSDKKVINTFVDNLLTIDSLQLRKEITKVNPDVDIKVDFECQSCDHSERMVMPIGLSFLYPHIEE